MPLSLSHSFCRSHRQYCGHNLGQDRHMCSTVELQPDILNRSGQSILYNVPSQDTQERTVPCSFSVTYSTCDEARAIQQWQTLSFSWKRHYILGAVNQLTMMCNSANQLTTAQHASYVLSEKKGILAKGLSFVAPAPWLFPAWTGNPTFWATKTCATVLKYSSRLKIPYSSPVKRPF